MDRFEWIRVSRNPWGDDYPESWCVVHINHPEVEPGRPGGVFIGIAGNDADVIESWRDERERFVAAGEVLRAHAMRYY